MKSKQMFGADAQLLRVFAGVLLLGVLVMLTQSAAWGKPVKYEIDPDHLSIGFLVDHIGYAKTLGMFRKASGSFKFDEQTGELSDVRVVIDTASVFTNHKKRDDHLRNADFLNSAEYPEMVFTASGARSTGERNYVIEGQLELLGQSNPVTLKAKWNKSGEYPFGGNPYVMGVSMRGSFKRSQFGMNYSVDNGWVGDRIELMIELEARRQ